ncbi:MAG: amino acid adenylation domain-containing protein, partial [Clostridia bacterium]|nr:amino acid adenylation domain-containing protein [Clostridia bacterium]
RYTYSEVDKLSDGVADYLIKKGIKKGDVVSVLINKSEYIVIASLGVIKSGAAYQPLDPSYPKERLEFMIKDSAAKALIKDKDLDELLADFSGDVLYTDQINNLKCEKSPEVKISPDDLFIMLYTSGSTGVPKGVMIEHKNINAFANYHAKRFNIDETSCVAAYASYGFDADMSDLYPTLIKGACVCVIPNELRLDLIKLGEHFDECKVTHALLTTQVGRQFAEMIKPKTLKYLFVGGEKLVPIESPEGYTLVNAYGPTEGTVYCTLYEVDKLYYRVPIGKALSDYKSYVLDKNMKPLPTMCQGELYIAGPQVARGYLNRPEENKKAFLTNHFETDELYKRLYKTGDVVRYLPDGTIDFIGRKDGQVKIRGFRVELSEVEKVIREFKGIKDATVKDFTDPAGVKYLCAYVVSDTEIDVRKLNEFIASKKPPYMVPAYTMQIDAIPLNQNQKVNKRALPEPQVKAAEKVMPENADEQAIYDILKDILGTDAFGVTTDIFEAGLTSVSSIRFCILLAKKFGRDVENEDLKKNPTIRAISLLVKGEAEKETEFETLTEYPITKTQEGIFVECAAKPGTTNYNIPILFKLPLSIDAEKLADALKKVIDNHPYVKTTLSMNADGEITAKSNDVQAEVDIIKLKELDESKLVRPFTILGSPLYRAEIYLTEKCNYLFLDFHHIICDGTSEAIILSDLGKAYTGEELDAEKLNGFNVALLERRELASEKYEKAKAYYTDLLKDVEGDYVLKKDLKTEKVSRLKSEDKILDINKPKLENYVKNNKLTLNGYFNFAFAFTLSKFLYKSDAYYTTIYSGRKSSKLSNTVSMLVKTLPVYVKYSDGDKIKDKLTEIKDMLSGLEENDLFSFADAVSAFGVGADVMFAYQGDSFVFDKIGGEPVESMIIESDTPKSAFSIDVFLENGKFRAHYEYDESLYNTQTAAAFNRLFELVLNELCVKESVGEINTLPKEDKELYAQFNDTKVDLEDVSFNVLVERQAELVPDKLAVVGRGGRYTYKTFNENCNKVAHALIKAGVKLADPVIMMMPRVANAYVVRQGIIKSGGAFVPVDPKYPDDRIEFIAEDCGAKIIVTTKELSELKSELIKKAKLKVITVESAFKTDEIKNPDVKIPQSSLCYVIYTSGSTGKPKGVMIAHKNLVNYVSDGSNVGTSLYRSINGGAIGCSFASFAFDASLQEECVPLSHGYTAVIATEEEIENPLLLAKTMKAEGVNIMFMTPSFVSNFIDVKEFNEALKGLKVLDMGAEAVPKELCEKLKSLGVNADIYNGYGPTEATITCTYHKVTDEYVTIGKPFANTEVYILDKAGHILPIGAVGDLTLAGECVGMGYLGLPEKTKENFIKINGKKAYRSGDLARYNSEGNVEFFGRLDNQVKLRGLRVELDEIEKVLNNYPDITRSIILVKTNNVDGDYLAAYFTARKTINTDDLTVFMSKSLTPYMIPKVMMQLEIFPLTASGKIDKKALPEPEVKQAESKSKKSPKNELERKLCAVFAKALGVKEIGIDEDFFDLGGTSLSASKIAMLALSENLPVAYKDVFDYPTVESLEKYINGQDGETVEEESVEEITSLYYNTVKYVNDVGLTRPLGKVMLTGCTGFLGIHVLKELLNNKVPVVALVRSSALDSKTRLKGLLAYYFDSPLDELVEKYVEVVDSDVTDATLSDKLKKYEFDTVINCAALVKHFAVDDSIERINVGGVENLIKVSKERGVRLVQISTLSVAGENVDKKFDDNFKMKENMLDFGQDISNKYVHSKFNAEKAILTACESGFDGKIIRVGNLMNRESDGEFQANSITNGFMRDLKGYATLKKFPVNSMDIAVDFSPIDEVAKTVLLLSQTDKKFTVFHSANSHAVQMGDIIHVLNGMGYGIEVVSDADFEKAMKQMMADEKNNMLVSSLINYASSGSHTYSFIGTDNEFTNKALYHLGYKWPITDEKYLKQAISSLASLDFFKRTDI